MEPEQLVAGVMVLVGIGTIVMRARLARWLRMEQRPAQTTILLVGVFLFLFGASLLAMMSVTFQ